MKFALIFAVTLALVATTQSAPMILSKRRFGQEHTPKADGTFKDIKDIAKGTNKEEQAGNLSGAMVRALLAKAPTCDQQNRADEVIDLAYELGGKKEKQLIKVAKIYRQLERNTPKAGQPSALCKKQPRHKELYGLVQAQDPTGKGKTPGKGSDKGKGENYAETHPVGGVKMPKIQKVDGDFVVNGNKFNGDVNAAQNRQCDIQHNLCFNKFNGGDRSFSGADCDKQTNVCKSGPPVFG
ncbi:19518_t:CDS:1 [Funneliformis geosporum]|uniref:18491_t:CDS:1 n=1 Tax=Funneliformis geosporum TaxID=1117311 RepID=A0A9W4SD96_9GLOM|nr:19518_t:CDS:1 [Funneliformis geosporum]CAI2164816.1 18491_t:CDS:1 [Funneliformis geosporum]